MTYLTHGIAFIVGIWCGLAAALWSAYSKLDAISKILNHTPKD